MPIDAKTQLSLDIIYAERIERTCWSGALTYSVAKLLKLNRKQSLLFSEEVAKTEVMLLKREIKRIEKHNGEAGLVEQLKRSLEAKKVCF
jgi:hypothetical protein